MKNIKGKIKILPTNWRQTVYYKTHQSTHKTFEGTSDYVRKYLDVKNHAFLNDFMCDFDHLYAQFTYDNQNRNNGCEIRAFCLRIMRVFKV